MLLKTTGLLKISVATIAFFLSFNQYVLCSDQQKQFGEKISFTTQDGQVINGLYKAPAASNIKTFILLHGLGSNQEEWQSFCGELMKHGYGFLSYDARGHGGSISNINKTSLTYDKFGMPHQGSEWEKMIPDLENAVKFLKESKKISKIGIMGASLGANIALSYAANNQNIKPVVLLSPGIVYAGIDIRKTVLNFSSTGKNAVPLLMVSSPGDTYSYQSTCLLYKQISTNPKAVFIECPGSFHGVQMLDKNTTKEILKFIGKY